MTGGTGAKAKILDLILDTGSSTLAVSAPKFQPALGNGTTATNLGQVDTYGDGTVLVGAVLRDIVHIGNVTGTNVPVAIAYQATANMFRDADGILGLAYQGFDDASSMAAVTWP
jgi:hypothetical protein